MERDQAILVDVFQYLIGNTDWSGVEMHNMELFQTPAGVYATIPYDFDFSGIIDARYAEPRCVPTHTLRQAAPVPRILPRTGQPATRGL